MKYQLVIIIPVKNEEKNIPLVIEDIKYKLRGFNSLQIFFVDDGSTDNSWDIIKNITQSDNIDINAIKLSKNYGKDKALFAALSRVNANYIVFYDCDMQFDSKYIKNMYDLIMLDDSYIIQAKKKKKYINKKSKIFYKIFNFFTGFNFDGDTYLKMFSNKIKDDLLLYKESDIFIRGIFKLTGSKVKNFEVDIIDRKEGKSKYNFIKLFFLGLNAITSFSNIPLRIITIFGLIIVLISIILSIRLIYVRLTIGLLDGLATFFCLFMLTSGFIIIFLGIIAEYISKIFNEVKRRPNFTIDDEK
jgi:glycosyltransferase involved in cell wall biosynthesis